VDSFGEIAIDQIDSVVIDFWLQATERSAVDGFQRISLSWFKAGDCQ
jgi:hypothetical protein